MSKLIYMVLSTCLFLSCFSCNNSNNSEFKDEIGIIGYVSGNIIELSKDSYGIDGGAYPNIEGSGKSKSIKYSILKNDNQSQEEYLNFFKLYIDNSNTFSSIFQIVEVGSTDWETKITLVSY